MCSPAFCLMDNEMPFGAIIFDLDGTLVHSAPDLTAILNRLLNKEGYSSLDETVVTAMIGDGVAALVERGFSMSGATLQYGDLQRLITRFLDCYTSVPVHLTQPYAGVVRTLATLRSERYRLGICTNKLTGLAHSVLAGSGIAGFFDHVVGSDAVPSRKPDPAPVREAVRRLGATVQSTLMVGDSVVDVLAARNAAIPVVLMSYGYSRMPPGSLGADAVVDRFSDLPEAIEELSRRVCQVEQLAGPGALARS